MAKKKPKGVKVIFKENRSIEIPIGREVYRFGPREEIVLPIEAVGHQDFRQVKHLFAIKE